MSARKTHPMIPGEQLEFEEAEVWGSVNTDIAVAKTPVIFRQRPLRKPVTKSGKVGEQHHHMGPSSLPVNIPDWSKILGREHHRERAATIDMMDDNNWEDEEDESDRLPPHEYLARTRVASMSMHQGVGRTLKGRDLSRVRNAIWKQTTGFED